MQNCMSFMWSRTLLLGVCIIACMAGGRQNYCMNMQVTWHQIYLFIVIYSSPFSLELMEDDKYNRYIQSISKSFWYWSLFLYCQDEKIPLVLSLHENTISVSWPGEGKYKNEVWGLIFKIIENWSLNGHTSSIFPPENTWQQQHCFPLKLPANVT